MMNNDLPNIAKEYKRTIAGRFMLVEGAKLKDKLSGEDFLVTKKMDGIMLVVFVRDGEVSAYTSHGNAVPGKLPCLQELKHIVNQGGINNMTLGAELYATIRDSGRERVCDVAKAIAHPEMHDKLHIAPFDIIDIALHCSDAFTDQRKRTVITWEHQDSADRQTQFDGRADRTGQLQHCAFVTLSSVIPAEQRFLMMNERKLRSLNANVEANQHADDAGFDMLNKYGTKVALEYLHDNPEKEVYFADDGHDTFRGREDEAAFITKFMRTLGLLKCSEQKEILDDVMHRYTELIRYLDEIGENDLRPNVLPLNATLLSRTVFKNGKRNSASVFGNDAMLDEVEVDVLNKPLTSGQIKAILPTLTSTDVLLKQIKNHGKQKVANIRAYYTQLQRDAARQLHDLRSLGGHYTPSHLAQLEERANNIDMMNAQITKVEAQTGLLCELLNKFTNGQAVGIPMALVADGEIEDNRLVDYVSVGLFLGFKVVGSKTTRSSIKAVFAVNDGRCRLDIPLTEESKLMTIYNQTHLGVMRQRLSKVTLDTWDSLLSNSTRERVYIVTGNLLSGIAYAKEFGKNVGNRKLRQLAMNKGRGHLVTYTDDMGRVKNGYMLSRMFRPTDIQLYAPKS